MKKMTQLWLLFVIIAVFSLTFGILLTRQTKAESPPSKISIVLKDFIQSKTDEGMDKVEIEDGSLLSSVGHPIVPYYQKRFVFTKDFAVQSVDLTLRSDLKEGTGLKIPNFKFEKDLERNPEKVTKLSLDEWFPEESYTWDIDENEDGTKVLSVTIYPFIYNALTTEYKYYKHYEFSVSFVNTFVHISSFSSEKPSYDPTESVRFDATLQYVDSKPAQILALLTIEEENKTVVDSLPMEELSDLPSGEVNFNFLWTNEKKLTGYLYAKLEIKDKEGNLLDFRRIGLSFGKANAKITEFRISQDRIKPNDSVGFYVRMQNTGSTILKGEINIKITDESSDLKIFNQAFENVIPGEEYFYEGVWQAEEAKLGKKYTLTAHVLFDSNSSEPAIKYISLNTPPVADFALSPIPSLGVEVRFDGTLSRDSDGEIVQYSWNFGDDTTASGSIVTHKFYEPGDYQIRLTVTDNAGDSAQIEKKVTINPSSTKIVLRLFIGKKTYFVGDIEQTMDTEPIILEGRTLLPIRYVAEAIGAKVGWIQNEKKATINLGETYIELWIGNSLATVNGKSVPIDSANPNVKPIVIPPGRTMLPIRFVAEQLGCLVEWLPETREVKITK
jgi:hypothetical protein